MATTPYTFILSTDSLNRNGYKVITGGINVLNFEKNPVLLVQHNRWADEAPPIGSVVNIRKQTVNGLPAMLGDLVFANTEDALEFKQLVDDGAMSAVSICFRALEVSEDPKDMEPGQYCGTVTKCELMEVSLVSIPGNADAVRLREGATGTLAVEGEAQTQAAPAPATIKKLAAGDVLTLTLDMEAFKAAPEEAAPTLEVAPTQPETITLAFAISLMETTREEIASLALKVQSLAVQPAPASATHRIRPEASERAGEAALAAEPAQVVAPARPTLAAAIGKEIALAAGQPQSGEEKETFDWLQKNDPDKLASIKKLEPERYNQLVKEYIAA